MDMVSDDIEHLLEEVNFAFLFGPVFHPAMAAVAGIRKELGEISGYVRTENDVMQVYAPSSTCWVL